MSKLIEQNQPKKSRFLKYSFLASISVGAIIAMPFEGMAMSINPLFLDAFNKKLLNGLSQSNETNTPQQIGTVMTVPFEGMASSGSTESLVSLSQEDHSNSIKNDNAINILKNRPKSFGASDNKKKRPPTRSKTFVGSEKIEQSQNTYTSEPTVQTLQKPEIIITVSSPTVSPASNSFVTAPTIQNTTLLSAPQSPKHIYQNTPPSTTVSSPSTPYQPTPKSKPNDGVRANTSQKPKAARKISFSEPQQTVQLSKPTVPPRPIASVQLPIKRSSTEVAVEIMSHISGYRENATNKLSAVTTAIEKTSDQKARKKAQDIKKQIISQQKNIQKIESQAKEKADKIKELDQINSTLYDYNKRVTSDNERTKNKLQIGENKNKIKKLETELASKKNEADKLSQKIDISVNKVVLTKPQEKAPVTEIPKAGLFLNHHQQLDMLTQQQRVNAARQAEVNRKKAEANEVKRNSAEYKDLINEREGVQLEQNQQYIAAEKTKKQQQAENKQRSEREKKNHQKEKARDIVNIREDIVAKMQQIPGTNIISNKLQELELKVNNIEDKKKKQEAQKQLSEIKKQEKTIKTATDKAQEIADSAKTETSRTEIQKLQTKMNGYYETVTNSKIAADIQNLEKLVLTPSAPPSTATIYNKAKPIMPLTPGVQGILGKQPEEEDGHLVPIQGKPQTYITLLPTDPKSMDSGLGSRTSDTGFSSNHNSNKAYENLSPIEPENQQQAENKQRSEREKKNHQKEKARDIVNIREDIVAKMQQIPGTNIISNKLQELELKVNNIEDKKKKQEAQKQLSEIKKQEKTIKTATDKAQEIADSAKTETSRTEIQKLQTKMNGYYETVTNSKIAADIQNLEKLVLTPSAPPSTATIYNKAKPIMPLTPGVQGILGKQPEEEDGYLVPIQGKPQTYITLLPTDPKSIHQETLTEESATLDSREKKPNVLQWVESFFSKSQKVVKDQEAGFGKDLGNEYQKEPSLNVDSKLIKKAAQLISDLEQKRKKIQETTISLDQKSLNRALQKINSNQQAVIKISQELQQVLIYKPKNVEKYSTKIEKKLENIQRKKDQILQEIEADIQVRREVLFDFNALEFLGYQNNLTQTLDTVARANSIKRPILFQNLLKDLEKRKQEAKAVLEQARVHKINNSDDNEAKEPIALVNKLLEKYDADIELVKKALEDNKENNRKNNNVRKLSSPGLGYLGLEEKFAPLRKYDALDEEFQKVIASKKDVEAEYHALRNQKHNQNPNTDDSELSRSYSDISSLLSDTELNLSPSSSVSSLNDLSSSNIMKLGKLKSKHEKIANDYKAKELELDTLNQDDPKFKELMPEVFEMSKDKIWLEGEIKHLDTESKSKVAKGKLVFSRSPSVDSINSVSSDDDYINTNYSTTPLENKIAALRTYQMAVTVKRQELEQLSSTSSEVDQIAQQIEELKKEEVIMHDAINACLADPSKLNNVSFEEINENLKQLGAGIPESVINVLESKAQKDPEDLASNGKSESTLPTEDEESEDKEVTDVSRELSLLPASSNDCALALSDCREKECLALGDGSKDEEDDEGYNSGSEEEEETIEQLSDSDGGNLETTAIDTAIPLEQEAKKEMQTQISENAPTLNQAKVVNTIVNNMIRNRLDASINMSNNMVAVGAGDEEEVRIKRGLWVRGMYGINNHGRVENINGYRGTNKGATIGFDVEIDNNIVGIAYSNVHSVFKFKNSKNNDKEIIDSHVVSVYGQKELPRNFALQALVSASKNFIKDKTTYSYGDSKIRSNVKHRNHSYNAEALLNYNYLVKNNLVITPNIGLRYGKSRDGVYNETGINVQEIALTMKENNILSGIVGTKVKVPLKDALKFNNLGLTFQGAVEHNFKEKTQRINRVVKIFDTEFKQNYAIPKQPKTSYNLGTGIMGSIKNTTISLDYNYYLNKHYRSHQGSVKLKVNL